TLQQRVEQGAVVREPGDVFAVDLAPRARVTIVHGAITFFIRVLDPATLLATRRSPDRPFWLYNAASAVGFGTWAVMAHFQPLDPRGLDLEEELRDSRFVGYMHRPDHPPKEDVQAGPSAVPTSDAGGSSPRHAGAEGKMGNPREMTAGRRSATRGPRDAV